MTRAERPVPTPGGGEARDGPGRGDAGARRHLAGDRGRLGGGHDRHPPERHVPAGTRRAWAGPPSTCSRSAPCVAVAGTTVTTSHDARITRLGAVLRGLKIDELPQLVNVVRGEMSLVGPRPDVPGFADALTGADRIVLSVRPGHHRPGRPRLPSRGGVCSPACADPETYNREVIWPEKVRINREYVENWSLAGDLRCLRRHRRPPSSSHRPAWEGPLVNDDPGTTADVAPRRGRGWRRRPSSGPCARGGWRRRAPRSPPSRTRWPSGAGSPTRWP